MTFINPKAGAAADSGKIPSELLPPELQKSTPVMEDFSISVAGILKLFKNLKPGKAAGPDRLKPILLKELCEEIAPFRSSLNAPSKQANSLQSGVEPKSAPSSKKVIKHRLQTTDDLPHLYSLQGP